MCNLFKSSSFASNYDVYSGINMLIMLVMGSRINFMLLKRRKIDILFLHFMDGDKFNAKKLIKSCMNNQCSV